LVLLGLPCKTSVFSSSLSEGRSTISSVTTVNWSCLHLFYLPQRYFSLSILKI
jgi:hypothetical protein